MGFEVIPAIDLLNGRCVRLEQGDYARETVFSDDPAAVAARWTDAGARVIHVVDLDGAAQGRPCNLKALEAIRAATDATIEYGGGLRDEGAIQQAFQAGAECVVLGTALVRRPEWVRALCGRWPQRIVVGIDVRDGRVATDGWLETSEVPTARLVAAANAMGVRRARFTDIARDGTLQGPNLEALREVVALAEFEVIAAGGVASLEDLDAIRATGADGAIIGQALYTGAVDLRAAIARVEARG